MATASTDVASFSAGANTLAVDVAGMLNLFAYASAHRPNELTSIATQSPQLRVECFYAILSFRRSGEVFRSTHSGCISAVLWIVRMGYVWRFTVVLLVVTCYVYKCHSGAMWGVSRVALYLRARCMKLPNEVYCLHYHAPAKNNNNRSPLALPFPQPPPALPPRSKIERSDRTCVPVFIPAVSAVPCPTRRKRAPLCFALDYGHPTPEQVSRASVRC